MPEIRAVEIVELIRISISRGEGSSDYPLRIVTQYWTKEGRFIVELDPLKSTEQSQNE